MFAKIWLSIDLFAESQFIDVLKGIWTDPHVDKRVKKRLVTVLMAWQEQYKDDPSMEVFAKMHNRVKKEKNLLRDGEILDQLGYPPEPEKPKKKERTRSKEEASKRKEKREQERAREREREKGEREKRKRRSFNFERV